MSSSGAVVRLPRVPALSWDDCRLLVESVEDYAIFMLDVDGCVATWNIGAEKIKGYKAHEIIGEHFSKFYPPEDIAVGKPEYVLRTAREAGKVEDEGWRIRKDGSRFWANVVITALRDENRRLRGYGKVTRDLTSRRVANELLHEAEERFHLLVNAATDYAIFMLDVTGHVSTWNVGAMRTKGYTADEIVGRHFSIFYTPEDRASGKPQRVLDTVRREGRFEEEGWRVRKDGTHFWASVVMTPLRNSTGALIGFAKVTRDLTARKQAEETERTLMREQAARASAEMSERLLRESEEAARRAAIKAEDAARRAEEASRAKDEFLATLSHELRTPLNALLGWSSVLRSRNTDPSSAKALESIHRNAQAQAKIVDDILDISRIITGQFRLDLRPVDVVAIANEALGVVRPSALAKNIALEFAPVSQPVVLIADLDRLRQVIWNLLSNAVKFTDSGGKVAIRVEQEGSFAVVSVKDTGHGIDPAFLPHVFERFTQEDGSTTRRFGGLGLGLAIVRHIVELHGGEVRVESEGKKRGALFEIRLPIRTSLDPAEAPPASGRTRVRR